MTGIIPPRGLAYVVQGLGNTNPARGSGPYNPGGQPFARRSVGTVDCQEPPGRMAPGRAAEDVGS